MAPYELVSLDIGKHKNSFFDFLGTYLYDMILSDVTLEFQGEKFVAHKVILASCSSFFKEKVMQDPCARTLLLDTDLSSAVGVNLYPEELEALIGYFYTGVLTVPTNRMPEVLYYAQVMGVHSLVALITEWKRHCREKSHLASLMSPSVNVEIFKPSWPQSEPFNSPPQPVSQALAPKYELCSPPACEEKIALIENEIPLSASLTAHLRDYEEWDADDGPWECCYEEGEPEFLDLSVQKVPYREKLAVSVCQPGNFWDCNEQVEDDDKGNPEFLDFELQREPYDLSFEPEIPPGMTNAATQTSDDEGDAELLAPIDISKLDAEWTDDEIDDDDDDNGTEIHLDDEYHAEESKDEEQLVEEVEIEIIAEEEISDEKENRESGNKCSVGLNESGTNKQPLCTKPFKCKFCDKAYGSLTMYRNHLSLCRIKPFACKLCSRKFVDAEKLAVHVERHEASNMVECSFCHKKIKRRHIKQHLRKHTVGRSHQCNICNKAFFQRSTLVNHRKIHFEGKSHSCDMCPKSFTSQFRLICHRAYHKNGILLCNECGTLLSSQKELKEHLHKHKNPLDAFKVSCPECGKNFRTESHLQQHMRVHKSFKCDECAVNFDSRRTMRRHMITKHNQASSFQCTYCDRYFLNNLCLKDHLALHSDDRRHLCNECGKNYKTKRTLWNHKRTTHSEKSYRCQVCEKTFVSPNCLKRHMMVHSEERSCMCPYCPKTYRKKADLKKHVTKTHSEQ